MWGHAALYVFIIAMKLLSGIFAIPLSKREFFKIGFSMVSSCELAFIISVNAWIEGLISDDTFDALILAALISILISPVCLRKVLLLEKEEKEKEIQEAKMETLLDDGERVSFDGSVHKPHEMHHLYFQLQTKSHGQVRWSVASQSLEGIISGPLVIDLLLLWLTLWLKPSIFASLRSPLPLFDTVRVPG